MMKFLAIPVVLWIIAGLVSISVFIICYLAFIPGKIPWLDEKIRVFIAHIIVQKARCINLLRGLKARAASWYQQQSIAHKTVEKHPKANSKDKWTELLARLNADPDNPQPYSDITCSFFKEKGWKTPSGTATNRKDGVPHGLSVNDGEKVCEFIKVKKEKESVWEKVTA